MIRLFITGFLQVAFVTANTYFISTVNWAGVAACGFAISWLWTSNVRRVNVATTKERICYASGAMSGGLVGLLTAVYYGIHGI